jgi:hypothetical protein
VIKLFCKVKKVYSSLLAKQFALAGGGSFTNPLMVDNVEAFLQMEFNWRISQKTFLYFIGQVIAPVSGISGTDISARLTGSFNMGVPGANSSDMEPIWRLCGFSLLIHIMLAASQEVQF